MFIAFSTITFMRLKILIFRTEKMMHQQDYPQFQQGTSARGSMIGKSAKTVKVVKQDKEDPKHTFSMDFFQVVTTTVWQL